VAISVLLAAGVLAGAIAVVAVGTGIANQPLDCAPPAFAGGNDACAVADVNVVPPGASAGLPRHFTLPAGTPVAVALAIRFAIAQLGTSYQFGGSCTDARECSNSASPASR